MMFHNILGQNRHFTLTSNLMFTMALLVPVNHRHLRLLCTALVKHSSYTQDILLNPPFCLLWLFRIMTVKWTVVTNVSEEILSLKM